MRSNLPFIAARIPENLAGAPASTVTVSWVDQTGGVYDPTTGATSGGTKTAKTGTLRAFVYDVMPTSKIRQHAEIQAGDLMLDVAPDAVVTLGDASTVTLTSLENKGARFSVAGLAYVQADVGEGLARAWDVFAGDTKLMRTLLLRRAT